MTNYGKTWKLESDFDLYINDDGQVEYVEDEEKLQQDLTYLLHIMPKEDIFHPTFGTNLIALTNARSQREVSDILKPAIEQYQYVEVVESVEIVSLDTSAAVRAMVLKIIVKVFGEEDLVTTSVVI